MVDLIAMKSAGVMDTRPYSGPHGMAIHTDGSLFVTCDKSNATLVIDPHSRRIIEAIQMPSPGRDIQSVGFARLTSNKSP